MDHSLYSYLKRRTTEELYMGLRYYLKENPAQHEYAIRLILEELQTRGEEAPTKVVKA